MTAVTQLLRAGRLAGHQPFRREAGQDIRDKLRRKGILDVCQLRKGLVVPKQLVLVELDQRDRERHLAVRRFVHHLVRRLHVLVERAVAAGVRQSVARKQEQQNDRLAHGKVILLQNQRGNAEQRHHDKAGCHARLAQFSHDVLVQRAAPLSKHYSSNYYNTIAWLFLPLFSIFSNGSLPVYKKQYTFRLICGILPAAETKAAPQMRSARHSFFDDTG